MNKRLERLHRRLDELSAPKKNFVERFFEWFGGFFPEPPIPVSLPDHVSCRFFKIVDDLDLELALSEFEEMDDGFKFGFRDHVSVCTYGGTMWNLMFNGGIRVLFTKRSSYTGRITKSFGGLYQIVEISETFEDMEGTGNVKWASADVTGGPRRVSFIRMRMRKADIETVQDPT